MKLKNNYSEQDRAIWIDHQYFCAKCGSNNMISLHHIESRSTDDIRKSIPLCHACHVIADSMNVRGGQNGKEFREWALKYTADWIDKQSRDIII